VFLLVQNYNKRANISLSLVFSFTLFISLLVTTTTSTPSVSAFVNQNIPGPYSPNVPGIFAPVSPPIGSPYYGYGPGYGGGYGGQSFGTGLIGLLPQVLGGIGSLFGQGSGAGYGIGDDYGYDPGPQYGNDQGFSEFETNHDPFELGYGDNEGQDYGVFGDSLSYPNTPLEDLRSMDSPSDDSYFSGEEDDFSQSPLEDLFG
jgi:hypothetical protein